MTDLLVVYGTLRSGTGWRERLGVDHLVRSGGPVVLAGSLYDLGWYPGLVADGGGVVVGEVLRLLDAQALTAFDRFEGYDPHDPDGSEYRRVVVPVAVDGGGAGAQPAWVYVFNRPVRAEQRVVGGDWLEHLATKSPRHS